jgi:hypothetical protein
MFVRRGAAWPGLQARARVAPVSIRPTEAGSPDRSDGAGAHIPAPDASVDTSVVADTPTALPEAPASANVRVTIAGREVQVTLRDTDEERLLARLQTVLERFPVLEAPRTPSGSPEGFCSLHNVPMRQTTKNGRTWWSHKTAEGWCKGRGRR